MILTLYNSSSDFKANENIIHSLGMKVLENTIKTQVDRENKIYSTLGLKTINEETILSKKEMDDIKNTIYLPKLDKDNNVNGNIDQITKILVDFLSNLLLKSKNINETNYKNEAEKSKDKTKILREIIQTFEDLRNKGLEALKERTEYANNLDGMINPEAFQRLADWDNFLESDFNITASKKKGFLTGAFDSLNETDKILKKFENSTNDIVGAVGEILGVHYTNLGGSIIAVYTTSGWGEEVEEKTSIKKSGKNKGGTKTVKIKSYPPRIINSNFADNLTSDSNFRNENKKYVEEMNKLLTKLDVESNYFKLKASSHLKADDVYVILTLDKELFYFGVSNKTSYSESNILKVQTTSLSALTSNIYKVGGIGTEDIIQKNGKSKSQKFLTGTDKTQIISSLLKELAFNVAYYPEDKDIVHFSDLKSIVNSILDYYAYVWLTGGFEDKSHADFLSAYSNGELHFIPMSNILKIIRDIKKGKNFFFNPLSINEYKLERPDFIKNREDEENEENDKKIENYYENMLMNNKTTIEKMEKELKDLIDNSELSEDEKKEKKKKLEKDLKSSLNRQSALNLSRNLLLTLRRKKHTIQTRYDRDAFSVRADEIISQMSVTESPVTIRAARYGEIMN